METDELKRVIRRIDLWTSSCMVATAGDQPIAALMATKRDAAALIWRIGAHPDHLRQGHGRHLLTSLSAKLAILGPPRMLAEVPIERTAALAFFEACGWRRAVDYTDWILRRPLARAEPSTLPFPITVDELLANEAFDSTAARCWSRTPKTLVNRKNDLRGLAVASDARIEASLLYEQPTTGGQRQLLALHCADESRREMWWGLLVREWAAADPRPVRFDRVRAEEVPEVLLRAWGFEPGARTLGLACDPRPA